MDKGNTSSRYMVAFFVLIPGAFLFAYEVTAVVALLLFFLLGPTAPEFYEARDFLVAFLFCWSVLIYWAASTDNDDRVVARGGWACAAAAFLVPAAGIMGLVTGLQEYSNDAAIRWGNFFLGTIIGLPIGFIAKALAWRAAPSDTPERTASIWYVLRPIGGGYFVLAVGLLIFVGAVLRMRGYEGLF